MHAAGPHLAMALLGGASLASVDEVVRPHVRANYGAVRLAAAGGISQTSISRAHEVACRPQLTHRVLVGATAQDHVLAGGEYKHHPNQG